jgi:hypothetical protein
VKLALALAYLGIVLSPVAEAHPRPVEKKGPYPSGFRHVGKVCAPINSRSRPVIAKRGPCGVGWVASGAYCLRGRRP